jgi:thiamine pyrophosphokinase
LLDTEIALNLLWDKGCDEVTLAGGGGGRLDHLLALRALFDRPRAPRRWVTDTEDTRCVEAGETLTLHPPSGARVSVLPAATGPWSATSQGLKWPLNNISIDNGWVGISNIAVSTEVVFTAIDGRFLVMVAQDEEGTGD